MSSSPTTTCASIEEVAPRGVTAGERYADMSSIDR